MKGWVGLYRSSRLSEISACLYCHTRHSTRWWQLTERNRWLDPVDICVLLTHLPTLLYLNLPIADLQVYGVVLTGSAGSWLTGVLCCTVLYLQGVPVADLQVPVGADAPAGVNVMHQEGQFHILWYEMFRSLILIVDSVIIESWYGSHFTIPCR